MSLRFYTHFDFVDFKVDQRKKNVIYEKGLQKRTRGATLNVSTTDVC